MTIFQSACLPQDWTGFAEDGKERSCEESHVSRARTWWNRSAAHQNSNGKAKARWMSERESRITTLGEIEPDGFRKVTISTRSKDGSALVESEYWTDMDGLEEGQKWPPVGACHGSVVSY